MESIAPGVLAILITIICSIPFLIIATLLIVLYVLMLKHQYTYECKICNNRIKKMGIEAAFTFKSGFSHSFYCPVCKKKTWHRFIQ